MGDQNCDGLAGVVGGERQGEGLDEGDKCERSIVIEPLVQPIPHCGRFFKLDNLLQGVG